MPPATKVFHRISFEFIKLYTLIIYACLHKEFICNFRKSELRKKIYNAPKIYSFLPTSAVVIQAHENITVEILGLVWMIIPSRLLKTGVNFNFLIRTLFLLWRSISYIGHFNVETGNKDIQCEKCVLLPILKDVCCISFHLFTDTLPYCHCRSLHLQILLENMSRNIEETFSPTNSRAPQFGIYPWFAAFYFMPVIPSRPFIRSIRI